MMTPADHILLRELRNPDVRTIGRARIVSLLDAFDRNELDTLRAVTDANADAEQTHFIANNLWLAASGIIGEAEIMAHPRLAAAGWDDHRIDLLKLVQLRHEAEAYRVLMGHDLPPLPTATPSPITDAVYSDPFPATH